MIPYSAKEEGNKNLKKMGGLTNGCWGSSGVHKLGGLGTLLTMIFIVLKMIKMDHF